MAQKQEQDQPVVLKGPSVLRSILAGSLAGAVEIGELSQVPPLSLKAALRIKKVFAYVWLFAQSSVTNFLSAAAITYPAECASHESS